MIHLMAAFIFFIFFVATHIVAFRIKLVRFQLSLVALMAIAWLVFFCYLRDLLSGSVSERIRGQSWHAEGEDPLELLRYLRFTLHVVHPTKRCRGTSEPLDGDRQ